MSNLQSNPKQGPLLTAESLEAERWALARVRETEIREATLLARDEGLSVAEVTVEAASAGWP